MRLACNHPCSLTSPRKFTKLPPRTDWWTAKPPRWKAHTIALPPGRGQRPLYAEFSHLHKVLCKSHKHQCMYQQCQQTRYHTQYTITLLWSIVSTVLTCPLMYIRTTIQILIQSIRIRAEFELKPCNTGRERLIRSHSSARFCFQLSGNST